MTNNGARSAKPCRRCATSFMLTDESVEMNGTSSVETIGAMNRASQVRRRARCAGWRTGSLTLAAVLMPMLGQAVERETQATIVKLYSYTQFGGGDIMVEVSTPATGCAKGFWISAADPG